MTSRDAALLREFYALMTRCTSEVRIVLDWLPSFETIHLPVMRSSPDARIFYEAPSSFKTLYSLTARCLSEPLRPFEAFYSFEMPCFIDSLYPIETTYLLDALCCFEALRSPKHAHLHEEKFQDRTFASFTSTASP